MDRLWLGYDDLDLPFREIVAVSHRVSDPPLW